MLSASAALKKLFIRSNYFYECFFSLTVFIKKTCVVAYKKIYWGKNGQLEKKNKNMILYYIRRERA